MAEIKTQLTIKQAIAEGYSLTGYTGHEFQTLTSLEDISEADLKEADDNGNKYVLAEKEPVYHVTSGKELVDQAIDDYYNDDNFRIDDTGEMDRMINAELEMFEEMATRMNAIYKQRSIWLLTSIELISDGAVKE